MWPAAPPRFAGHVLVLLVLAAPRVAGAQPAETPTTSTASPAPPEGTTVPPLLEPFGYVEAFLAYNASRPSNRLTAFRGFDNRHATFSLQNVVLGSTFARGPVEGRIALQVGTMPGAYYGGEPRLPGGGGVTETGPELWKYLQEAYVGYEARVSGRALRLQMGLFASPIGFESFAVKDNWNWSRSNLFFGLPYYHTGARATYDLGEGLTLTASVFNGWNSVVDDNVAKSVQANVRYERDGLVLQALYFGGIERAGGAPEGPWWRHHFDGVARVDATPFLSFAAQADFGFEPNRFGTARWWTTALYARVMPARSLFVTLRGDRFHEHLATSAAGASTPLFWDGAEWVSSATITLDARPHDNVSVRLEGRHDVAEAPLFYGRDVRGEGTTASPFVANARTQTTLLVGATAWF